MTWTGPTPRQLGYRWPAEWEPQQAVWLAWPHNRQSWPGHFDGVPEEFAQFVRTLSRYQRVEILAGGRDVMAQAQTLVGDLPTVRLHDIPTNDAWCRDHGPTFLAGHGPPALVDWKYNAWGGKYPPFDLDDDVPRRIAELTGRRRFAPGIVLEGGAIENNGRGCLLTTASCLLSPTRNPDLSQGELETYLREFLSVEKILWIEGGAIAGDDTDGHIDQLARFVNPTTLVVATCEDPSDENYEPTRENWRALAALADVDGRPFTLVPLPLPSPMYCEGQRLPASYCNFLITNKAVIVPQFGDSRDSQAIKILASLFPGRDVLGCPSRKLVWGLGSFHCLSQQEPVP
jgi:agmatine deiminase